MAVQLDQKQQSEARATGRRTSRAPLRRETSSSRDSLVAVARQTLVQMRASRRGPAGLTGPRAGTRG